MFYEFSSTYLLNFTTGFSLFGSWRLSGGFSILR